MMAALDALSHTSTPQRWPQTEADRDPHVPLALENVDEEDEMKRPTSAALAA